MINDRRWPVDRRQFLVAGSAAAGWLIGGSALWGDQLQADAGAKQLLVHSQVPHNSEPALQDLVQSWLTPLKYFYVRSHGPTPTVDGDSFRLKVDGMVDHPLELSLAELQQQFGKHSVVATLTCAGNRRCEHSAVKPVSGVQWQAGAIGNARWGGARLSELLAKAGVQAGARHVWFEGVDQVERPGGAIPFGASIPLDRALADSRNMPGALVAYEMNDQPLTPDHGFPLRTVVPGMIGARSVKWLGRITVSDRPSSNHFVAGTYKLVTTGTPEEVSAASPLYEYTLNSVICLPGKNAEVRAGKVTVEGYALAPGAPGRTIAAVEVSADGGQHWHRARFTTEVQPFCWCLWSAEIPVSGVTRELIVRATDSAGTIQPQTAHWNLNGYQFDGWYHTPIRVGS